MVVNINENYGDTYLVDSVNTSSSKSRKPEGYVERPPRPPRGNDDRGSDRRGGDRGGDRRGRDDRGRDDRRR